MVYLRVDNNANEFVVREASWAQRDSLHRVDLHEIATACDLSSAIVYEGLSISCESSSVEKLENFCALSMLQGYHVTKEDFDFV